MKGEKVMSEQKKTVLITGGAMGQGRAHAVKYAQNGFNVVLADMLDPEDERFQETIKELNELGAEVLAVKANICSTPDMENLFAKAWEKCRTLRCSYRKRRRYQLRKYLGADR